MALQIWLPLNGNLENKGIMDISFSSYLSETGLTINSNGKLGGSCYERTAVQANSYRSNKAVNFNGDVTICCWAYMTGGSNDVVQGIVSNHNHGNNGSGFGINFMKISDSVYRISCSAGRTSNDRVYNHWYGTTNIKNAWHHLAFTYNRQQGRVRLYVDGKCEKIVNDYFASTGSNTIDLFAWSTGYVDKAEYRALGRINDVRFYDHCLSGKEISLVAQGLVAHYPLDGGFGAMPTLLDGNYDFSTGAKTGTVIGNDGPFDLEVIEQTNTSTTAYKEVVSWGAGTVNPSEIYTASFYARSNTPNNLQVYFYNNTSGVVQNLKAISSQGKTSTSSDGGITINLSSNWEKYWITWTLRDSGSAANKTLLFRLLANNLHVQLAGVKLEKGPEATEWLPKNFSFDIAYDCSGYRCDGQIVGPVALSTPSPRGNCAMVFNGSSTYINCGRKPMVKEAITVSCWGYMDDWTNYSGRRLISCTDTGGWNLEPNGDSSSNGMNFAIGTGTTSNSYHSATSNIAVKNLSPGWHLFTGTYDGFTSKIYIDGELRGNSSTKTTKTPIFYNASNSIFIGAEAGTSATTPAGAYFNGKISDVRIYATALNAEDIKELYNTPISIGKNGAIMGAMFKEV